ncbi:MAG: hypothetical protein JXR07_20215 [Reichenbachiella sp.]
MKIFFTILATTLIISCSTKNHDSEIILEFSQVLLEEFDKNHKESLKRIEEVKYDNFNTKFRLYLLDSLTKVSIEQMTQVDGEDVLNNWRKSMKDLEIIPNGNIDDVFQSNYKFSPNSRCKLLFEALEAQEFVNFDIGASRVNINKVETFVIPTKTEINLGEKYKALITVASYSSHYEKVLDILIDGNPIPIKNGFGLVEITPSSRGIHEYTIEIADKDEEFFKAYDLNKTVQFTVK